jgi:predicted transcriptional regulator
VRSFEDASQVLGDLETRVMNILWADNPLAVRDVKARLKGTKLAYTTVMTTLDRLYRKGVLLREKSGRAFLYRPRFTRAEFESARAADALRTAIQGGGSLTPIASCLIDAVGDRDRELLDELEALVAARRADQKGKRS